MVTDALDALGLVRRGLQTWAFCLVVSAVQYALLPDKPYGELLVYSLCIGTMCWAIADGGRCLVRCPQDAGGWPRDWRGPVLMLLSLGGGFVLGTTLADAFLGRSSWKLEGYLRNSLPITVAAGVAITYFFHSRGRSAYLEADVREAAHRAAEARLRLLESQLEPHMLFNTLANLRVLIDTDTPRAQNMLDHLIDYLRATLSASRATLHPLADEFARLADYLALMQVRMGPRLDFHFDLPPALAEVPVPPLLLQPLVENSIRHGLEPHIAGGSIRIAARTQGSGDAAQLVLEVEDTGAGWPEAGLATTGTGTGTGKGYGLAHVGERLATAYGAAAGVHASCGTHGGARVTVHLPLTTAALP